MRWFVRLVTPAALREEVEGDLTERHRAIEQRSGRRAANRWIWRQVRALEPLGLRRALKEVRRTAGSFGGPEGQGEATMRGWAWREDLWMAWRAVRGRRGTSATVVATIALGVAATTAVFSVVNGVLLRPLPYPDADRLVQLWQTKGDWMDSPNSVLRNFAQRFPLSVPTLQDWTQADTGFEVIGAWSNRSFVRQGEAGAEIVSGQVATSGLFEALRIEPAIGRPLQPQDDQPGAPRVAVLSHGLWLEMFGGDPDVLVRDIVLDGAPHTIVGVMPREFAPVNSSARLWVPLTEEDKAGERNSQFLTAVGRLAPGVSLEQATERLAAVQARLAEAYPDAQGDVGSRTMDLIESVVGQVRSTLWLLLGAVVLVLVIASVNVANLLSVVGFARRREMAVKVALGARPGRIARGFLVESGLLAGSGGLIGLLGAQASLPLLLRLIPSTVPRYEQVGVDARVVAFALVVTVCTALVVGALPALQTLRAKPTQMMGGSARGASGDLLGNRVRNALVVSEVALAFVLLVGAGLLGTSFARLWSVERGFAAEGLVALSVYPDPAVYPERDDRDRFLADLRGRLDAIPGAVVSATNQVPLSGSMSTTSFEIERDDAEPEGTNVLISVVLENYFDVMEIPVVEGRGFQAADGRDTPPVGLVSRTMAERLWPGESAVGKRLRSGDEEPWITVVGVAGDVRHQGLHADVEATLYLPAWQSGRYPGVWVVRVREDAAGVIRRARAAVSVVSPTTPLREATVLDERIARSVAVPRFRALFIVALACVAAGLALLGVFGVVALSIAQRTREIGVRLALGARPTSVVRRAVASGVALALAGVAVGWAVAVPTASVVRSFLYEIEPTDPLTYALMALGVAAVSAAASWIPARRAASVDPMRVLSSE